MKPQLHLPVQVDHDFQQGVEEPSVDVPANRFREVVEQGRDLADLVCSNVTTRRVRAHEFHRLVNLRPLRFG